MSKTTKISDTDIQKWFEQHVQDAVNKTFSNTLYCNSPPEFNGWEETLRWAGIKIDLALPKLEGAVFQHIAHDILFNNYGESNRPKELDKLSKMMPEPASAKGQSVIYLEAWANFTCEVEDEGGCSTKDTGRVIVVAWLVLRDRVAVRGRGHHLRCLQAIKRQLKIDDDSVAEAARQAEEEGRRRRNAGAAQSNGRGHSRQTVGAGRRGRLA